MLSSTRPDLEILGPHWVGGTPESVAEVRIRRSLEGEGDAGELPLRARITLDPERLTMEPAELGLEVDLSAVAGGRAPLALRVSVGIHLQDGGLQFHHRAVGASPSAAGTWSWTDSLPIPQGTDAAVVVIHDLIGNVWGENFAEFITSTSSRQRSTAAAPEPDDRLAEVASPTGPALRLVPLPANTPNRQGPKVRSETRPDVR